MSAEIGFLPKPVDLSLFSSSQLLVVFWDSLGNLAVFLLHKASLVSAFIVTQYSPASLFQRFLIRIIIRLRQTFTLVQYDFSLTKYNCNYPVSNLLREWRVGILFFYSQHTIQSITVSIQIFKEPSYAHLPAPLLLQVKGS